MKEREVGTSPLRLQVTDRDAPHTPAWRAKYTVHGAAAGHFQVETDGESNDGILTVVKVRAARLHVAETTVSCTLRVIYDVHARLSALTAHLQTHSVNHCAALSVRGFDDGSVGQQRKFSLSLLYSKGTLSKVNCIKN